MIRNICRDIEFLSKKAGLATKDDVNVARDLMDTLNHYKDSCVGMAANMIGVNKSIICVSFGVASLPMFNPVIVSKSGSFSTSEGCLSLIGERETIRYDEIEVEFFDMSFTKRRVKYNGFVAQIIQHEIDHLNGIII